MIVNIVVKRKSGIAGTIGSQQTGLLACGWTAQDFCQEQLDDKEVGASLR